MIDQAKLRAVFDTNVVIAALLSRNPNSPLVELLTRWRLNEFQLLYSLDLLAEYHEKLVAKKVDPMSIVRFLGDLGAIGELVQLSPSSIIPYVPADPDDDVVVACAVAGQATHLVTYDPHILDLGETCAGVRILDGLHFLYRVRGDTVPVS